MSELPPASQAKYIGWQGAFYNFAKLVAPGGLVGVDGLGFFSHTVRAEEGEEGDQGGADGVRKRK